MLTFNLRAYLKHYFTSKKKWIGDYVRPTLNTVNEASIDPNYSQDYFYLITPNIWPLNRKYKDYVAFFYGFNDEILILLTFFFGF